MPCIKEKQTIKTGKLLRREKLKIESINAVS
jgi:hypothetical protein